MRGVVTMGNMVLEFEGMMPPRTAMVSGARKTVVCSCRGTGMGARECHSLDSVGWEKVVVSRAKRVSASCMKGNMVEI
jgi:hypothetical protein